MTTVEFGLGGLAVASALFAIFAINASLSALLLWVAGLAVGGIFLSAGAELLAVTQWIVSTVGAIAFMFFSLLFGEYWGVTEERFSKKAVRAIPALTLGAVFAIIFWLAVRDLVPHSDDLVSKGPTLLEIGKAMVGKYLMAFEVFVGALFCVLIGVGVVARPDREEFH